MPSIRGLSSSTSGSVSGQASFNAARTVHHQTPNAAAVSDPAPAIGQRTGGDDAIVGQVEDAGGSVRHGINSPPTTKGPFPSSSAVSLKGKRRKRAGEEGLAQDAASSRQRPVKRCYVFSELVQDQPPQLAQEFHMLSLIATLQTLGLNLKNRLNGEKGATAVEYGIMVGLIAVVIIVAVSTLGGTLNGFFTSINSKL
jgi:pilus assembly protein Flp/PilA